MKVGAGEFVYRIGAAPCSGAGVRWPRSELIDALNDGVAAVLFDDEGRASLEGILVGLAETDFAQDGIRRLLEGPDELEDWRFGEATAETYVTDHRSCTFFWPDARDE